MQNCEVGMKKGNVLTTLVMHSGRMSH